MYAPKVIAQNVLKRIFFAPSVPRNLFPTAEDVQIWKKFQKLFTDKLTSFLRHLVESKKLFHFRV